MDYVKRNDIIKIINKRKSDCFMEFMTKKFDMGFGYLAHIHDKYRYKK